jgi:hypothetical protein
MKPRETDATFIFIFFWGSGNEYRNPINKYCRKHIWNEYSADTDEKQMIAETIGLLESWRKN